MDTLPYIGICKVCNYGMLEILYNFKIGKCSIMCDECLAEWNSPEEALDNINGFRKSYPKAEARRATLEEVANAKWEKYVI